MSKSADPERSQTITFEVPIHLVDAFIATTDQFFAQAHEGTTPAQRAADVRAADRDAALDSLALLLQISQDDGGQAPVIVRFLAGLYNGRDFPFDLTELRDLDEDLKEHCLAVLRLHGRDAALIQNYFPDGAARWQAMITRSCVNRSEERLSGEDNGLSGQTHLCEYIGFSDVPGFREVTLFATVRGDAQIAKAIGLTLSASDCARLAEDLTLLHQRAWDSGTPSDAAQDEQKPEWLSDK